MLSAINFGDYRFFHSDPFSHLNEMESEIAELRTMTKVTKLRQQIECRQEGAWMMVRDVPDDKSKRGSRKVTTYGRTTRSVTRSISSNLNLSDLFPNGSKGARHSDHNYDGNKNEVIIEFPDEDKPLSKSPTGVEITEVIENEPKPSESSEFNSYVSPLKTSPTKKTSVVTLGQGNLVLIDPEDSNFKVTGVRKDDHDISANKSLGEKVDKKVKKVGFSKTEVHFAPDSGKVNIVETDEKPPSQLVRKKKKLRREGPVKNSLPKLYFGDSYNEKFSSDDENKKLNSHTKQENLIGKITEHVFPVIREPSPLLSTRIANRTRANMNESWSRLSPKKAVDVAKDENRSDRITKSNVLPSENGNSSKSVSKSEAKWSTENEQNKAHYLGNVSPKLSQLIQNNIQHEFQLKQMQIMNKSRERTVTEELRTEESRDVSPQPVTSEISDDRGFPVNIVVNASESHVNQSPIKIVTHINVNVEEDGKRSVLESKGRTFSEPVYANNDNSKVVSKSSPATKRDVERVPKPRSSFTKIVVEETKERKRTKQSGRAPPQQDKGVRRTTVTPKPREAGPKREVSQIKTVKPYARNTITRLNEPCKRSRTPKIDTAQDMISTKSHKVSRTTTASKQSEVVRAKKAKEPLRSFEKVSNGWVSHCIVPLKTSKPGSKVTITSTSSTTASAAPLITSSKTQGVKRDSNASEAKNSRHIATENKTQTKSALTSTTKQFSLSKEHLKSAKLVKELFKENDAGKADVPRPKLSASRIKAAEDTKKSKSLVSRRRLMYEEGGRRLRQDSEQSDDSVVRADEEVRAYMFDSKQKVVRFPKG